MMFKVKKPGVANVFKLLSFSAFLILIVLCTVVYVNYLNIQQLSIKYQADQKAIQEEEWNFINAALTENQQKATLQSTYIKDNISRELLAAYGGNTKTLKRDMDEVQARANTPLLQVISNNIKDKYINNKSDANDLFVIGKWVYSPTEGIPNGAVIGDKSLDCSKSGELRTFDIEINMHSNKELALDAIKRVLSQNQERPIFWEFLQSKNPNHAKIKYCDIEQLHKVFLEEGLEGLKTYEILNPTYITGDGDILLTADVDNTGNKNNNYKIIVVQGFSLYEALQTNHSQKLENFNYNYKLLAQSYEHQVQMAQIETMLICVLIFVVFISIVRLQNLMIDHQE